MRRPPRLCSCGKIVPHGALCACQQAANRARNTRHDQRRPTARQRGYTHQWERAARAYLNEPGHELCACGAKAILVRHIVSIRRRPDLRMVRANWQPGCVRCNALDTQRDRQP